MQPVINERALIHEEVLTIADLHLGFEYELANSGINLPSATASKLRRVKKVVEKTGAEKLIILGDLKHEIHFASYKEKLEIKEFIKQVSELVDVEVVKGNHDSALDFLSIPMHSSSGVLINNVAYFHGNAWPSKKLLSADYFVMAHSHPTILFEDRLGHRSRLSCWLRGRVNEDKFRDKFGFKSDKELIVMPAFSKLVGGGAVNTEEGLLGPFLKLADLEKTEVYLLDGTNLGCLEDLTIDR